MEIRKLKTDILILGAGGAGLFAALHAYRANPKLSITVAVSAALDRIHEFEHELGCVFDRNADGSMHQKQFAGQSFDRTVRRSTKTNRKEIL